VPCIVGKQRGTPSDYDMQVESPFKVVIPHRGDCVRVFGMTFASNKSSVDFESIESIENVKLQISLGMLASPACTVLLVRFFARVIVLFIAIRFRVIRSTEVLKVFVL